MRVEFIECDFKGKVELTDFEKLPKKIALCSTVQFVKHLATIKRQLEETGREVELLKTDKGCYEGQVLGCSKFKTKQPAVLFIGDGMFHPINLKLWFEGDVWIYDPYTRHLKQLDGKLVEKYRKHQKGALIKFLHANEVGVLISTKQGQCWDKFGLLEKKYKKKVYYLVFDEISFAQLENFSLNVFINTSCPRLGVEDAIVQGKTIINIEPLLAHTQRLKGKIALSEGF